METQIENEKKIRPIRVGEKIPNFTAEAIKDGKITKISLSDYQGKWLVLFFWPLDFTFVCPTEIQSFNENYTKFKEANSEIVGGSVDSVYSHKAWQENGLGKIEFPMISDMTKEITRMLGTLDEEKGIALRGTFIINPDGILQSVTINNLDVGRNVEETLRTLKAFQTGKLCQATWKVGDKTLA